MIHLLTELNGLILMAYLLLRYLIARIRGFTNDEFKCARRLGGVTIYTPEEKVLILKRHLVEHIAVSVRSGRRISASAEDFL